MAKPQAVLVELASCTGARPKLNQAGCLDAIKLIRDLAAHQRTVTVDALAREWGLEFLQAAQLLDVDMNDQRQRWAAFSELERRDPVATAREERTTVAKASLVLRYHDGTRFVRAGWFRAHVRSEDVTVSPQEIAQRIERVGWRRPGGEGWIKATRPGFRDVLKWRFYTVPARWEERFPDEAR
jgi:hypothetical protein